MTSTRVIDLMVDDASAAGPVARVDGAGSSHASSDASAYRPGACNIGPAEIERRRRSAWAMTATAAVVALALIGLGVPPVGRWLVTPFAAAAAVGWLQVLRRFCVAFGALGVQNFGRLGARNVVADPTARAADRRTVILMLGQAAFIGLGVAAVLVLLPV